MECTQNSIAWKICCWTRLELETFHSIGIIIRRSRISDNYLFPIDVNTLGKNRLSKFPTLEIPLYLLVFYKSHFNLAWKMNWTRTALQNLLRGVWEARTLVKPLNLRKAMTSIKKINWSFKIFRTERLTSIWRTIKAHLKFYLHLRKKKVVILMIK